MSPQDAVELRARITRLETNQREQDNYVRDQLGAIRLLLHEIDKRQVAQGAEQRALVRATRRQSIGGLGAVAAVLAELLRRYLGG